jgi:hypothetical protein
MRKSKLLINLLAMLIGLSASAQQKTIGIFDGQVDVGKNTKPGAGIYLPETRSVGCGVQRLV